MPSGKSKSKENTWTEKDLTDAIQGDKPRRSKDDRKQRESKEDRKEKHSRDKSEEDRERVRACSYGKGLSRLVRKHFDSPDNFVLFIWDGFPAKRESIEQVVFIWHNCFPLYRDLAYQQARSRLTGKLFISYEYKVTFYTIFVRR